jgi:hypothetical protein
MFFTKLDLLDQHNLRLSHQGVFKTTVVIFALAIR